MPDPLLAVPTPATPAARLAATLAVVAVLTGYILAVEHVTDALRGRASVLAVELLRAGALVAGIGAALWVVVAAWGVTDRVVSTLAATEADAARLVVTVVVGAGTYAVVRVARRTVGHLGEHSEAVSAHGREVALYVVQVTVFALAALLVLSVWEVNLRNLLLGAGVVGIVVGLAARQTLGAALAGFVVLFARPFEVGDWVLVNDREGVVRDITLVNTRLQTFDDEHVVIPNDRITGTEVVNRSREGRLRVEVDVEVAYDTDLDAAREAAADALDGPDPLADSPTPRAVLAEFGDSGVTLRCRAWIRDPTARRYWRARTAMVQAVEERFTEDGIEIPLPKRDIGGELDIDHGTTGSDGGTTSDGE